MNISASATLTVFRRLVITYPSWNNLQITVSRIGPDENSWESAKDFRRDAEDTLANLNLKTGRVAQTTIPKLKLSYVTTETWGTPQVDGDSSLGKRPQSVRNIS